MANIKISENEEKFIKAMNNATNSVISKVNIKLTENEEKFLRAINNSASSVGLLSTKHSDLFKTVDAVYKNIIAESDKINAYNNAVLKVLNKIDFVAINKLLQEFLDSFNQFVEFIEEEKRGDYYFLLKKYAQHLKEKGLYVSEDFNDFLDFWIPYNIQYFDLKFDNHNDGKFRLEVNDFVLFHEYETLKIYERLSEEEATERVWNKHDKRNITSSKSTSNKKLIIEKKPNHKQKRVLKLIVEEMKKGTQKTDAINDSYQKAGYQNVRQVWTIVGKVEKGKLLFNELTEILNNN